MIIEKSPFYNKKIDLSKENSEKLIEKNQATKISDKEEDFSFWSWFKGLVNPLQNLPLISGIYSSVNAENNESDRDLIQNSLGGFLYGGPFGAIAGFGNWVFEKLFDKTPTELAFDKLGISNLWKDKKNEINKVENDLNLKTARKLLGYSKIIGISANNEIDITNAIQQGCDYIGIGPVFETATKKNKKPIGIEKIKTLTKDLNIPWFAIGGIKSNNISYLKRNGFKKVALVSQLMNSEDPKEDAIMILKELSHEN